MHFVVTATTRAQRERERDGVDYHFLSAERFQQMMERGELLERAQVYGNWYGVPRQEVEQALERGLDVMVKADVQGAATIKSLHPGAVLIFLAPPSMEDLERRLRVRKTESAIDLELRLKTARQEMERLEMFDYVVVNRQDEADEAVAHIEAILTAEKRRTKREL